MKTFQYQKSIPIIRWGCSFDSLLELKYAISIQDEYEFIRARVSIFFDPKTKQPTDYIRGNTRRYTPDFLIRHKQTGKAFMVELKPRAFEHNDQLIDRREIAEKYIQWKKYDWSFLVVFDDEIKLTTEQQQQFHECCKRLPLSHRKLQFEKLNNQYDRRKPSFFKGAPGNKLIHFVMFGT
jgi:hypothetical protein